MREEFNMQSIISSYEKSRGLRELGKWAFSIATGGIGALYLWANTVIVKEGEIGLRRSATGKMVLLPPGRHSNFPWEDYPVAPQSLANKAINLGPYKIITVETGYVAKTYDSGKLDILEEGQHLIQGASHTFVDTDFIPIKQETERLADLAVITRDNISLTLKADVTYEISDPKVAVTKVDNILRTIKERATMNIANIVGHHYLSEFAPATSGVKSTEVDSLSSVVSEISKNLAAQLLELGIKLLNIGIISTAITDKELSQKLGETTVLKTQIQSQFMAAENEASRIKIKADAESYAITARATAEAEALKMRGDAIKDIATSIQESPAALSLFQLDQKARMVSMANNCNLFFNDGSEARNPKLVTVVPASTPASTM